MTADQFAALADLLRLRKSPSNEAARLVLVEGLSTSEAAKRVGIKSNGVSNVLASCRRGMSLARRVAGLPPEPPL
ncbi:hypothetical protein [Geopseudomonas aromaticivorans]